MTTNTTPQPPHQTADVSDFDREVVEASGDRPVVVDFWAPWCGPCHQLAPLLEAAAAAHAQDVTLVKLNVDEHQALAQRYRVQGIPAVKAFRDGEVVAEFTGVQPQQSVDRFFAALVPSAADRLVVRAADVVGEQAEALLRDALAEDVNHAGANLALARLLADRGDAEEARRLLAHVPGDGEARRLAAELDLGAASPSGEDRAALTARADAGDAEAAVALGRLLAAESDYDAAIERLLGAVADAAQRAEARESLLTVFAVLGDADDRVRAARPKLAAALF
ncbi:tetratricopeptide repeat protein [soil metagenome]